MNFYNKKSVAQVTSRVLLSTGLLLGFSLSTLETTWSTNNVEAATVSKYTAKEKVNLRSSASWKGKVYLTIPKGKTVTYLSKSGTWYKVKYGSKTGYVPSSYLTAATAKSADSQASAIPATNYQTTSNLNVRSTSSASGKILAYIPKGKIVTATATSGTWLKVTYGGKTGWVSGSYLKEYDAYKTTAATYFLTNQSSSLYPAPNTKNIMAYSIPANNVLTSTQSVVNSKGETWYRVAYKGKNYFVQSITVHSVVPKKVPSTEYAAKADTSLYSEAGDSHPVLTSIPQGTQVTSTYQIGDWCKVTYGNQVGFIDVNQFSATPTPGTTDNNSDQPSDSSPSLPAGAAISQMTVYNVTSLNLRQSDLASATLLKEIPANTKLTTAYKTSNGWYQVSYGGKTGFVSGSYLIDQTTKTRIDSLESNPNSYLFMDLRTKSSVTAAQIDAYIASRTVGKTSVLTGQGQTIINAANKYGVNALYLAAHAIHESGFGVSAISLGRNNLFGYGAYDITPFIGSVKFNSIASNIDFIAQSIKATYLNPASWKYNGAYLGYTVKNVNGSRIDSLSKGMNFYYASDSNWGNAIATHMSRILSYNQEGATSRTPDTTVPSSPSYPDLKDVFPVGTLAIAKSNISVYLAKGNTSSVAATIPKGATFNLLEKYNDYWLTVSYNGQMYYTNSVKFNQYNQYFTVKNLARVNTDSLNVRSGGDVSTSIIGTLTNYQYVELVLDASNNPIMSGTWYQVKLADGTEGYVSGSYIVRELNK